MLVLLLLWVVYLVAVPIWPGPRSRRSTGSPTATGPPTSPARRTSWSAATRATDLTEEERKELSTGDAGGQRTDTIMLLHTGDGPNLLLSIPRDSIVDIPGHGTTKINAAYAFGGAPLLVQTIEQDTGIRIDEYVEIGMGGVAGVVDAVGGIEICPTQRDEGQARRPRHQEGLPGGRRHDRAGLRPLAARRPRIGDIDRVRRQREVVAAVGDEGRSRRGRCSTRCAGGG